MFAYCPQRRQLIFREQHAHTFQKADYRIVPVSALSEDPVEEGPAAVAIPDLCAITLQEQAAQMQRSAAAEESRRSRVGVGVSVEAQFVFDFVSKTCVGAWREREVAHAGERGAASVHPRSLLILSLSLSCRLPVKWQGKVMIVTDAVEVDTERDFAQSLRVGKRAEDYTSTQDRLLMIIADSRRRFECNEGGVAAGTPPGAGGSHS